VLWKYFQIFIFIIFGQLVYINSRIIIIHYIEPFRVSRDYRNNSTILEQMADKSLFMFSEKGKEHSVEKLKNNLLSLIDISLKSPDPLNKSVLLGKRIRHYFWKNGDREPYDGRVVSIIDYFL
jgi:hypothetical protein